MEDYCCREMGVTEGIVEVQRTKGLRIHGYLTGVKKAAIEMVFDHNMISQRPIDASSLVMVRSTDASG